MISSWEDPRGSSPVSRPWRITRMRSGTCTNSGSSELTIRMAAPDRARLSITSNTSTFAPTSMPRVGSSKRNILAPRASHLAITTFC